LPKASLFYRLRHRSSVDVLLVVAGVIAERLRKRRRVIRKCQHSTGSGGMSRVPPEQLFSSWVKAGAEWKSKVPGFETDSARRTAWSRRFWIGRVAFSLLVDLLRHTIREFSLEQVRSCPRHEHFQRPLLRRAKICLDLWLHPYFPL